MGTGHITPDLNLGQLSARSNANDEQKSTGRSNKDLKLPEINSKTSNQRVARDSGNRLAEKDDN